MASALAVEQLTLWMGTPRQTRGFINGRGVSGDRSGSRELIGAQRSLLRIQSRREGAQDLAGVA
jgi:hypothetical protein